MRPIALFLVISTAAAAQDAAPPAAPPAEAPTAVPARTIAVLPLRVEGLQLNEVQRINVQLRLRAETRGNFEVQSESDTTQLLEASQSLGLNCDVNAIECGVRLGQIADVAFVLLGRATGGLDAHVGIDVSVVDVKAGTVSRRISALLPTEPGQQAEAMNAFAEALFAQEGVQPLVSLALVVEPAGADVIVDGAPRGTSPLAAPVGSLLPGDHHVIVQKKGFVTYRTRVAVLAGETARLEVTLVVDPEAMRTAPGGLEAAAPWLTAGVGGVALVGGIVASSYAGGRYLAFEEAVQKIEDLNAAGQAELDDDELETIRDSHAIAEQAAIEWTEWGQTTFVAGIVAAGIGVIVTGAGVAWGVVQLNDVDSGEVSGEVSGDDAGATTTPSSTPGPPRPTTSAR